MFILYRMNCREMKTSVPFIFDYYGFNVDVILCILTKEDKFPRTLTLIRQEQKSVMYFYGKEMKIFFQRYF